MQQEYKINYKSLISIMQEVNPSSQRVFDEYS